MLKCVRKAGVFIRDVAVVFRNQFNKFRANKFQMIFFLVWAVVTLLWPLISSLGLGEPDNWDYPRQIAPALGLIIAGGLTILIFASETAEQRENGSLARAKLASYFLGVGGFYVVLSMIMAVFIALVGTLSGLALVNYMLIILLAIICAFLIGSIIGVLSKTTQMALTISYPIGLALALLFKFRNGVPAFQMINPIRPYINWFYMERINKMLIEVHTGNFISDILVILGNIAVLAIIFAVLYKFNNPQP